MKIRYYLRGLGLGILVTAVFFLLGDNSSQNLSDEMIKERAKELGMIESTVLADMGTKSEEETELSEIETESEGMGMTTEEESISEVVTEETAIEGETALLEPSSEESVEVTEELTSEEITEDSSVISSEESTEESDKEFSEEKEEETGTGQFVSIVVNNGEGSDTVSRRLYEAGLIGDASAFDQYLMQNKYDRKIAAGEHLIEMGSSWGKIAKVLCR